MGENSNWDVGEVGMGVRYSTGNENGNASTGMGGNGNISHLCTSTYLLVDWVHALACYTNWHKAHLQENMTTNDFVLYRVTYHIGN